MRRVLTAAAVGLVLCAGELSAQGVGAEITSPGEWDSFLLESGSAPKSLAGLKELWVSIQPVGDSATLARALPTTLLQEFSSYVPLELRKTGIRIATNPRIVTDSGGHLEILIAPHGRMFGNDWRVRFEIQQVVELVRDSTPALLPTWSHEEIVESGSTDALRSMIHKAMDVFLSDWLTANGR